MWHPLPRSLKSPYFRSIALCHPMAPNLLNIPSAPLTSQLLQQFGSGLSSRDLPEASKIDQHAKELYAQSRDRYLYICLEPAAYASAIGRQSREEALWTTRQELYRDLINHQIDHDYHLESYDELLGEPQPGNVGYAEGFVYEQLQKFQQLAKAQLQRLRGNFRIPMVPRRSIFYPWQWFNIDEEAQAQNLLQEKALVEYLDEQDSVRTQWKHEAIHQEGKTTYWIEGYWLCPDTEHPETPELNLYGHELNDAATSRNGFDPVFPLWQRQRFEFMNKVFTERREHLSRWLRENGMKATENSIKQSSFLYAIAYYKKQKTSQVLQGFTATVNSCRLITEKHHVGCDCQAPTTGDIYEQLRVVWESIYELFELCSRFQQNWKAVECKREAMLL